MIRITQLRLPCGHPEGSLEEKIRKTLRSGRRGVEPVSFSIVRHSVDARKKPVLFDTYTVDVETGCGRQEEQAFVRRLKNRNVNTVYPENYRFPDSGTATLEHRPVIIGAGPAGLFCALFLAEHGYRPLLLERGQRMEERTVSVERFWKDGLLDPDSNVQFGEGGAGTFSDGKLNTQINDKTGRSREVLKAFVEAGAPESILYEGMPHIGTDRLREVIPALRRRIEKAGGEVRFGTTVTGFSFSGEGTARRLTGLYCRENLSIGNGRTKYCPDPAPGTGGTKASAEEEPGTGSGKAESFVKKETRAGCVREEGTFFLPAEAAVLAVGHSARDTIEELYREEIPLEQKQFAVGLRVSHPQSMIDKSQYGISDPEELGRLGLTASPYKLTARASSGRGVYSFCMCPGGTVVNASSVPGYVCVNGMSDEKRDSGWANSAIVITVGEKEFGSSHVLAGMEFQRKLEKKAWELGAGSVPVQYYTDFRACFCRETLFEEKTAGSEIPGNRIRGNCRMAPLHELLPETITADFIEGMEQFGQKIRGFNGPQALLAGVESRTSSPVRISRTTDCESVGAHGLYPCGEGAGYAGGIMSAAMDGIRIAEAIARIYAGGAL